MDSCGRNSQPRTGGGRLHLVFRRDDGNMLRLESVQNAVEQGKAAAATLLGREKPFHATPWFWSDQYEFKLQMAGLSEGFDVCVERPGPEGAFSLFYYRDGRLIAVIRSIVPANISSPANCSTPAPRRTRRSQRTRLAICGLYCAENFAEMQKSLFLQQALGRKAGIQIERDAVISPVPYLLAAH